MLTFNAKCNPTSLVKAILGSSNYVGLELSDGAWWLVASDGRALVRLPGNEQKDSVPDVPGGIGVWATNALRHMLTSMGYETFGVQADEQSIELYGGDGTVIGKFPRVNLNPTLAKTISQIPNPAWEYDQVLVLNPQILLASAKAMNSPDRVCIHMPKATSGVINEKLRLSVSPFAGEREAHGFMMPIAVPPADAGQALRDLAEQGGRAAAAGVRARHPWAFEPAKPVEPVKPMKPMKSVKG